MTQDEFNRSVVEFLKQLARRSNNHDPHFGPDKEFMEEFNLLEDMLPIERSR